MLSSHNLPRIPMILPFLHQILRKTPKTLALNRYQQPFKSLQLTSKY